MSLYLLAIFDGPTSSSQQIRWQKPKSGAAKQQQKGTAHVRGRPDRRFRFGIDRHNFATGFSGIFARDRTE
jgi:hypothetical protein